MKVCCFVGGEDKGVKETGQRGREAHGGGLRLEGGGGSLSGKWERGGCNQ